MHSLEAACNEAQNLIDKVEFLGIKTEGCSPKSSQASCISVPGPSWSNGIHNSPLIESPRKSRVFNIRQRLKELYLEECRNTQPYSSSSLPLKNLKRGSRLLEKLVQRENLNTLIVNLYPGNKGYSLSLRLQGKVPAVLGNQAGRTQGSEPVVETMRWPYSDEELLRCIDNEEIPATLVDLLEANHSELFYQGCVIAEIRDYRLTFPLFTFETHHVLLKPTTQSIINDVNVISSSQDFSAEDRLSLESQIVLATAPPLCLDPNPAVGILINNLHYKKQRLSTVPLRKAAKKFSQVTMNRKRKLDQFTAHHTLQIYDFITRKKAKLRTAASGKQTKKTTERALPMPPPVPSEEMTPLQPPSVKPDVFKFAKHYEKSKETTDCSIHLVEEYILETERGQGRIYRIKLSILQRHSNMEYLGELYVDRDYKEGEKSGASCRFVLGTRVHANRYIQQFTEIFTEEGRKSVRITHVIPGQQHHVSYTPGMRERSAAAQAKKNAQPSTAAVQGKQSISIVSNAQNNASNSNSNFLQTLSNQQQLIVQSPHVEPNPANTVNYNLNSSQIQKLQGQLISTANSNSLPQSSNTNSNIQISAPSHLTNLLTNSNVGAAPNINIHQIHQAHNVMGITGNQNVGSATIQSLLENTLGANMLSDESSSSNLTNGSVSSGVIHSQSSGLNSLTNATVHHPPTQIQPSQTKPSRASLATNPAISALVTSLMNSAQQFQVQQAAQQAANNSNSANMHHSTNNISPSSASNNIQNSTILSLLNATTPCNNSNIRNNKNSNSNKSVSGSNNYNSINDTNNSKEDDDDGDDNNDDDDNDNDDGDNDNDNNNNDNDDESSGSSSNINNNNDNNNSNNYNNNNNKNFNYNKKNKNITATSHMSLSQQNKKLLTRKTITNLLNSRLINHNLNAVLNNNVANPTLVVNNANSQQLRVTLSSLNQLMNGSNRNAISPNHNSQILNINQVSGPSSQAGFTIFPTVTSETANITTQTFTVANANPQTFTNPVSNHAYSLNPSAIGNLAQSPNQTFTITTNTGNISPESFTISPANSSAGFTLSSSQNSGSQSFTVLQPNQAVNNQSLTLTGNQEFTVANANQTFTLNSSNLSPVQSKSFQINNVGTTNQTFSITTPVVTVSNQFVSCQSPSSSQNYSPQASPQTFTINASTQSPNTTSVFTVNSSNQVFAVSIQSPLSKQNFNQTFPTSAQSKSFSQSNILINKNQTLTISANQQNFPGGKNIDNSNSNDGKISATNDFESSNCGNIIKNNTLNNSKNIKDKVNNKSGLNFNSSDSVAGGNKGKVTVCQRRLSNALQQASHNSELNKLLLERCDSRLLTDTSKALSENSRVNQAPGENKKFSDESNKLSQALTDSAHSTASSNLGLSMPGLSALLAGTPSADNPIPGASNSSSLLERLTSSAPNATAFSSPPLPVGPQSPNVPALSPNQTLNFQNSSFSTSPSNNSFNSANLNSPLSNIMSPVPNFTTSPKNQIQFQNSNSKEVIGITSPLSSPPAGTPVSLNIPNLSLQGITGLQNVQVTIPGLPVPILSLNVSGQAGSTQGVLMTSLPIDQTTNTTTNTSSPIVLANSAGGGNGGSVLSLPVAQLMTAGVKNSNQRTSTSGSVSLSQLQLSKLQLQKQAQVQQCYQHNQKRPMSPSSISAKHRRRSNTADSNK